MEIPTALMSIEEHTELLMLVPVIAKVSSFKLSSLQNSLPQNKDTDTGG